LFEFGLELMIAPMTGGSAANDASDELDVTVRNCCGFDDPTIADAERGGAGD
jgi:hypothetical protein